MSLLVSGIKADEVNKMKSPESSKHLMIALNIGGEKKVKKVQSLSPSPSTTLCKTILEMLVFVRIRRNFVPSNRNCKFLTAQIILAL